MQPLGKNVGGYGGERIDIAAVLRDCSVAARAHKWSEDRLTASPGLELVAFSRTPAGGSAKTPCIYISTGIHGDEPAGPLAALQLLNENLWPQEFALRLCPCLNPIGFELNRRENASGVDLNREYLEPHAAETIAHVAWLRNQPQFSLCLCLHEDWESRGFYVYELNPEGLPSLAEPMIAAVERVCPIDLSPEIEGRPAHGGIIRPELDPRLRPQWPESFFLLTYKTRISYTLEAPSEFPLQLRVAALVTAVRTALESWRPD